MSQERSRAQAHVSRIFWAALALMIIVSGVAIVSTNRLIRTYSNSARSHQVLLELNNFLSALKDVESGVRGYALTHDRAFLNPYRSGMADLGRSTAALKRLEATEAALTPGMERIERLAQARVAAAGAVIVATASGEGQSVVLQSVMRGKSDMDRIRRSVASISAAQQVAYDQRRVDVQRQTVIANLALSIGMAMGVCILLWLSRILQRQMKRRQAAKEELSALNAELEVRVQARTAEVEEARRMLDAVIENIPATVFLKDSSDGFKYVFMNKAGEKLSGHPRENFIGHADHELYAPDIAAARLDDDRRVAESGENVFVASRVLPTERGTRIIETAKLPIQLDRDGKTYVLGIIHDLTEQKHLEVQVREMQRLESVGRLTGGIAHDFNNLLAIIMGSVEMVREDLDDESETAVIADEALDAVGRGADLVRRLLAFARKQHLDPTNVDLNDRLPTIVPLLERTLGERIRVRVDSAPGLWSAKIDATQVDDALVNLAINARDAMPDGGALVIETANVVLDGDYAAHHAEVEPGEYIMLAVSDSGTGMTEDTIARAFEPFFTTKAEGKGTGLGLSQVYGWVKQSGGHIKIYSELDRGTTIKLYLPRADGCVVPEAGSGQPEDDGRGHETVLLVEDNPSVRRAVVRQLNHLGYSAIEAADGDAAFAAVAAGVEFDLLLTDVVMPGGINGYELAQKVEELRPGTPTLFTSGYTELAETNRGVKRTGPLISKPYSRKDLGKAIRAALGNPGPGTE